MLKLQNKLMKIQTKNNKKTPMQKWTQKNKVTYFGYKNHIKIDAKSKIITKYEVTSAVVNN